MLKIEQLDVKERSGRYLLNDVVYATDDTRPACLLTVCLPSKEGGEDWWVNEYHVARGTYVTVCCSMGCTLYADAGLTQPIDDTVDGSEDHHDDGRQDEAQQLLISKMFG